MNIQLPAHIDKAAFLAWAEGREGRYELVRGRVVMMTGFSRNHGRIVMRIARLPDVRARMKDLAVEPEGTTSEELARVIRQDIERWTAVAKQANVRIEP